MLKTPAWKIMAVYTKILFVFPIILSIIGISSTTSVSVHTAAYMVGLNAGILNLESILVAWAIFRCRDNIQMADVESCRITDSSNSRKSD
jgi:uncharacterized oligopeptide transporter (OPT) family protein